ncbi:hypothetical protein MNNICLKF_01886 [Synechococcus sp. CBW1107]|nr:hypothetical protein MNNICLKF_01886 [Synechococcus sp. CBW1107]
MPRTTHDVIINASRETPAGALDSTSISAMNTRERMEALHDLYERPDAITTPD